MRQQRSNNSGRRGVLGSLVVLILTGCGTWSGAAISIPTLDPSLVDSSVLTGVPCAAPCWYGLEVDRSTKADVLAVAPTLSFVDPRAFPEEASSYFDPMVKDAIPATTVRLSCRRSGAGTCASLVIAAGVLKGIYLSPPPSLTLGEAVDHLGAPEYVGVVYYGESGVQCHVSLLWKQRGIVVQSGQVRCQDVRGGLGVRSDLPVVQIAYRSLADFASIPEAGGDFPWSGFAKP